MSKRVAILGASEKPDRYANMAQKRLAKAGHDVFPVSRNGREIMGVAGYSSLKDLPPDIDTVTVYVRSEILHKMIDDLIALSPERVIFNPGTEAPDLFPRLEQEGIRVIQACTLVLLSVDQFESA